MQRFGWITIVGASALFAMSCGDDDKGGGSSSGVSGSKLLTDLTTKEVQAICKSSQSAYRASIRNETDYCNRVWIVGGESCEMDLEECKESNEFEDLSDNSDCEDYTLADVLDPDERCTATVADYEACDRAYNAAEREHYEGVTCEDPESVFEGPEEDPEACLKLVRDCPALE